MPSVSRKQHNFMEAVAHSAKFAKEAGVPQSVGRDFAAADAGRATRLPERMHKAAHHPTRPAPRRDRP